MHRSIVGTPLSFRSTSKEPFLPSNAHLRSRTYTTHPHGSPSTFTLYLLPHSHPSFEPSFFLASFPSSSLSVLLHRRRCELLLPSSIAAPPPL